VLKIFFYAFTAIRDLLLHFFTTKDEHKVEHKTILSQVFTRTCEISYSGWNRTQKPKRKSSTPYCRAIRKCLRRNRFYHSWTAVADPFEKRNTTLVCFI